MDALEALDLAIRAGKSEVVRLTRARDAGTLDPGAWAKSAADVVGQVHCIAALLGGGADPDAESAEFTDDEARARTEAALGLVLRETPQTRGGFCDAIDKARTTFAMERDRHAGYDADVGVHAHFDGRPSDEDVSRLANEMIARCAPSSGAEV